MLGFKAELCSRILKYLFNSPSRQPDSPNINDITSPGHHKDVAITVFIPCVKCVVVALKIKASSESLIY